VPFAVLVVDDDPDTRANLRDVLELDGYEVEAAGTAAAALARDDWDRFGAVLLDRQLPDGTAEGLLPAIRARAPDAAVMIVTGSADVGATIAAFRLGATDYVLKPINPDELRARLGRVAARRRDREALRASEERFATAFRVSPDAVVISRLADGRILEVNPAWEKLFGYPAAEAVGRTSVGLGLFADPADRDRGLARLRERGTVRDFDLDVRTRAGEVRHASLSADRLVLGGEECLLTILRDVTERRRAEQALRAKSDELRVTTQQLWQAARLAGVGELAASIAHELNNPLATVGLRVEGLLDKTPPGDPRRRSLEVVDQEVRRMAGLVSNLLGFSRAGRDEVCPVDLREEAARAVELVDHHLARRKVRVETDFAPAAPVVPADPAQVRQVLLNLLTNAADAMRAGGRLTVRVRPGELAGRPAAVLEVADTGVGIPPELLPRVFDPFFTTKADGQGTGLGLVVCKRIVDQHQGTIAVESAAGVGTTVRVTLPVRPGTDPG
jgi:PAS domain S-box-containing protein